MIRLKFNEKTFASVIVLLAGVSFLGGLAPQAHIRVSRVRRANPPAVIDIPTPPIDVVDSDLGFAAFDDYSWRAFIAMVWPAKGGQRGVPDTTKTVDGSGPRVFETYKATWEIFHNLPNSPPAPWNKYESKKFNPCKMQEAFGDVDLASVAHSELGQASYGGIFWPLASQNKRYVRFLTGFDKTEFDTIVANKYYERKNLPRPPSPLAFPTGAIDVKSAWMLMDGVPNPGHFYTRMAMVRSTTAPFRCSPKLVGLVGLHIVQKTPTRPQWIWSSFEQEDNVPDGRKAGKFNLNNGTGTAQPSSSPLSLKPLVPEPVTPYNVDRLKPIHPSTQVTNQLYRAALPADSVWRHYKLVMTQWPTPGNTPKNPGHLQFTIPGRAKGQPPTDTTNTANMAMESYHQKTLQQACMNCHTGAQPRADFLWTLYNHSYPSNIP